MQLFSRWILIGALAAMVEPARAQPALTTIQDTLYKADGTRYSGTMTIRWNSFQTGDSIPIATQMVTLEIVNGSLKVQLVPTTTSSPGASYAVNYESQGRLQFTETWAVPPSSTTLRLRDVRVSSGTVVGPPPVTSSIFISDVSGLSNELAVRPQAGSGFGPSRAAVINFAGQIDAATGNPGDCVRVDGSAGPCGGEGGGGIFPTYVDNETPAGLINGLNLTFTLNYPPSPASSLQLYRNGMRLVVNSDFTLSGQTITFFLSAVPQAGDALTAQYRYGDSLNPLGAFAPAQVICSSSGTGSTSTNSTQLGTCTIPTGILKTGDRISIVFQYSHTGSNAGIGAQIFWGMTPIFSRSVAANESQLGGRIEIGLHGEGAAWSGQSWGASSTLASSMGSAADNFSVSLLIDFQGQTLAATSDRIVLRNFTVIRYPTQSNP